MWLVTSPKGGIYYILGYLKIIVYLVSRLAPVLKTIFHQCVISYTCSKSNSGGSFYRAIRVRLATSIWYGTLMKNCLKDWSQSTSCLIRIAFSYRDQSQSYQLQPQAACCHNPLWGPQRNANSTVFCWWAETGPLFCLLPDDSFPDTCLSDRCFLDTMYHNAYQNAYPIMTKKHIVSLL